MQANLYPMCMFIFFPPQQHNLGFTYTSQKNNNNKMMMNEDDDDDEEEEEEEEEADTYVSAHRVRN
jgi:hypothetical protein